MGSIFDYIKAFAVGGALCIIGQLLIDGTKLTPARILTIYVVAGVVLGALGIYQPLADFAGAGAYGLVIILISFVIVLVISIMQEKGIKVREAFEKQGVVFKWIVLLGAIFGVLVLGVYGPGYNAMDFIYKG